MSSQTDQFDHHQKRLPDFDFNEWKSLFESDPIAFEQKRVEWIETIIESAPATYQHRLKGLMFKVDIARDRAKTPIQSCIAISQMMWSSTTDLRCFLDDLACLLQNPQALQNRQARSAEIIEFGR